jgi:acyl carrier protein
VLPAYMLPDSFVQLAALPLTTNGKIDKNNLPEPDGLELDTGMLYVAPRNETEERLATIWQEVLSKERIGMKDGFFEIGGQSIAAMRLISRIRKDFEVEYSIDSFYKYPTIEAVAVEIEKIKWASGSLSNTNNIIDAEIFSI